jgi:D-alanyl-lipoteichoic acid acyltransferase DltB (MBOAT superfamily)
MVTGSGIGAETILLPLAISFFTFQQIAYLVDAYEGLTREYNFLHYCLFVTFFPQLIAGPIVHHREMLPQFASDTIYRFNQSTFTAGLTTFCLGLFKKVIIADGAATYATPVFDAAEAGEILTFFEAWTGAFGYTIQLYFDFSGYSDMAIGLGMMFGIRLPLNFFSPYKAVNIIDFWRRWHMTLSRFLRDYLYIPLGGSRRGKVRRYVNLMVTMLLGGLWHGAGWTFVAWGALHGFYLVVNHAWHAVRRSLGHNLEKTTLAGRTLSRIVTLTAVIFAWVLFRAESFGGAMSIISGMVGLNGFALPSQVLSFLPFMRDIVENVSKLPLLGGGTITGLLEMLGLFSISAAIIAMPAMHELSQRVKLAALLVTFYFTLQAVLFTRIPSEFLYFQF